MITVSMPQEEYEENLAKAQVKGMQHVMDKIMPFLTVAQERAIAFHLSSMEDRKAMLARKEVEWRIPFDNADELRLAIGTAAGLFHEPAEAQAGGAFYESAAWVPSGISPGTPLRVDIP